MTTAKSNHVNYMSSDYYMAAVEAFNRVSTKRAVLGNFFENELPSLGVGAEGSTVPIDGVLRVLSVGPGNGGNDSKILIKLRQREQRRIHAVIVEPNPLMIARYKALIINESEKMRGIDFEWRQETLEDFQKNQVEVEDKFHFITSVSSIYYIEDKEKYLQFMYDKLEDVGVLMITVMTGETPSCWTSWLSVENKWFLFSSCDLMKLCEDLSIPVSEKVHLKYLVNITPCFARPLQELSEEGSMLLDFLTHRTGFTKTAPVEYQESVLKLLGTGDQTVRDASGQVLLRQDHVVFIIRGKGQTSQHELINNNDKVHCKNVGQIICWAK